MKDMSGQSQGYGYVEFTSMPDASKAMQQWDGQEVVGQKLSVKVATMGPGQGGTVALPQLDLDDDEGKLADFPQRAILRRSGHCCMSTQMPLAAAHMYPGWICQGL